jgi:hypothetical protein
MGIGTMNPVKASLIGASLLAPMGSQNDLDIAVAEPACEFKANSPITLASHVSDSITVTMARELGVGSVMGVSLNQAKWQELIDNKLIEWGRDPSTLEVDDFPLPSVATIGLACRIATILRDQNQPPPQRVCPDTEGGIAFERGVGRIFMSIRIRPSGQVEMTTFEDGQLLSRSRIF